jgi:hypothetical protein
MNMPSCLFFILWTTLPLSFLGMMLALAIFRATLKKEAPLVWESLDCPELEKFGRRNQKLGVYLRSREYQTLNNPRINRAAMWANLARQAVLYSIPTVIFYYGFRLLHLLVTQ